jgi:pilus assembly protein Flp/PilA
MNNLIASARNFIAADDGVTMIEYGLLAALIAVVSIAAITTLGTTLQAIWGTITAALVAAG